MDKRKLRHLQTRLHWLKPWYFLVLTVISAVICVFALRANNQQMVVLRDAVFAADKDNGDVKTALQALQAHVTSHMNTNLATDNNVYPPIQLKYTYERLVKSRGDSANEANRKIYSDAQAHCEGQNANDFSGRNRIPCIQNYVQSHTTAETAPIDDSLYKFAFASPRWSPDLAGWSMLAAIISGLLFVISLLGKLWLRHATK